MRSFIFMLLAAIVVMPSAARGAVEYTVTDLTELWQSSLPYYMDGIFVDPWYAKAMNDHGQIVGSINSVFGDRYAFLWDEANGLCDLGNFGRSNSHAEGINNLGQVIGGSETSMMVDGLFYPFIWSESTGMQSLGSLYLNHSWAQDVNDIGTVVGRTQDAAFIWTEAEGMRELGNFGGVLTEVEAVNNHDQAVGVSITESMQALACIWEPGSEIQALPSIDEETSFEFSTAKDINNNGDIVGYGRFAGDDTKHALLWHDGQAHDLGSLDGTEAYAEAINDNGDIVGYSHVYEDMHLKSHAFIWDEDHGMRDINELISPDVGMQIRYAIDINNNGWILAETVQDDLGNEHMVLLRPVPEPGAAILFLTAAICLLLFFRFAQTRIVY